MCKAMISNTGLQRLRDPSLALRMTRLVWIERRKRGRRSRPLFLLSILFTMPVILSEAQRNEGSRSHTATLLRNISDSTNARMIPMDYIAECSAFAFIRSSVLRSPFSVSCVSLRPSRKPLRPLRFPSFLFSYLLTFLLFKSIYSNTSQ